jgi:hypothetical protein
MNPIEEIEVENKTQARIREQYFKKERERKIQVLNAYNPYSGFTNKTEYNKNYYQENSEQIKKYYEENREEIREQQKLYYKENKQKINEKANEEQTCPCGGKFTTSNKKKHLRSLKHLTFTQACLTPTTL